MRQNAGLTLSPMQQYWRSQPVTTGLILLVWISIALAAWAMFT